MREAVTRLRAEGLVETQQGRGSFVLAVPESSSFNVESSAIRTQADVLAMLDFRIGVESEAAALAALHHTAADAAAIEDGAGRVHPGRATRGPSRPTSPSTSPSRGRRATGSTSTCSARSGR